MTSRIQEALRRQQEEFVNFSFKTVAGQKVLPSEETSDEVTEMFEKLVPLIPYVERAVEKALIEGRWSAEVGDYYGEKGLCLAIKRVEIDGNQFNTDLHKPSLTAFNKWAQYHFRCPRMRLCDNEHHEGSHTLELWWSPETKSYF